MSERTRSLAIFALIALLVYSKGEGVPSILAPPNTVPVTFDGRYVLMVDTLTTRTPAVANYMASKRVRDYLAANTDGFRHWYSDTNASTAPLPFREMLALGAPKAPVVVASKGRRAAFHPIPETPDAFLEIVGAK